MLRLATFNVLHGQTLDGGPPTVERLVEACAALDADVLCLQEIDRGQPRSAGVDQTAAVAAGLGAAAWRFQPALVGEPGATWRAATDEDGDCGSGEAHHGVRATQAGYGVGIVSRLAVERWHVRFLPAARVRAPVFVPGGKGRFLLLPDEPRVVLAADLAGAGGGLRVATTHLSFVPVYNLVQLRRATRWLASLRPEAGCVLLGDLNAPGPFPAMASGWSRLARAGTFPADRPSLQIDHALGHGRVPPLAATSTRRLPLSDHLALVVDLTVTES